MKTFRFKSNYQGDSDFEFWRGTTECRAERRGTLLRLLDIDVEAEALALAQRFNDERTADNLQGRDEVLAKYGEEMLRQVWKPYQPVTRVMFCLGGKLVEREVTDGTAR